MPYTIEDFMRDVRKETLEECSLEERLAGLPPQEVAQKLSADDRLAGLPPEKIVEKLSPDDRLAGLSEEQIENYLKKLRSGTTPSSPN